MSSEGARELAARADAELREHLAQVILDGAVAEVELRGDLGVGQPLGGEASDLRLLRREVVAGLDRALADGLPGRQQLAAGALGERMRAHRLERVVRGL